MSKKKTQTNLSIIMRNRRALRLRGVTAGALHILEAVARQAPEGLVRLSVAALGRIAGVGRSTALRHIQRLEALGMVLRVGPSIMCVHKTMLRIAADAVAERAQHLKRLFTKRKSKSVRTRQPHRTINNSILNEVAQNGAALAEMTRQQALRELETLYIPVHLRNKKHHI